MTRDEDAVRETYRKILAGWNTRDAKRMAAPFAEDGQVIGFDGSVMNGRTEILDHLSGTFADHPTAAYVSKVRGVRFPAPQVALLTAIVGMVPPGGDDINPAANAHQTLLLERRDQRWEATLFQNTPAQFHGRPHLVEAMTEELREVLQEHAGED